MEKFINVYYKYYFIKVLQQSALMILLSILCIIFLSNQALVKMTFIIVLIFIFGLANLALLVNTILLMVTYKDFHFDSIQRIELSPGHLDFMGTVRYDYVYDNKNMYTKRFFSTKIYKKVIKQEFQIKSFYAAYNKKGNKVVILEKR